MTLHLLSVLYLIFFIPRYLLSILTTYVRKTKPELELALHLVKKLRGIYI